MTGYIYTKVDDTGNVNYVGATTALKQRRSSHKNNLEVLEVVEVESNQELFAIENFWIEQFRQWGFH